MKADGELELSSLALHAQVHGEAIDVSRGDLRVPKSVFEARLDGPLADPSVRAVASAHSVAFRNQVFSKLSVEALGTARQLLIAASLDGSRGVPNSQRGNHRRFRKRRHPSRRERGLRHRRETLSSSAPIWSGSARTRCGS